MHLPNSVISIIIYATPPQGGGDNKNSVVLKMDETTRKSVTRRLASAAGHIKGIERMVNEDVYCINIIQQIQAVQAALNKVSGMMLDNHLRTCVTTAIQGDDPTERERMLTEVTGVFEMSNKL
jgi:DNA-binding FrmR family transcriptional regulator